MHSIDLKALVINIYNGSYLLERGWFINNIRLQEKVQYLKNFNVEHNIFALHGDFEEHVDYLIGIINQLYRREVQFREVPI